MENEDLEIFVHAGGTSSVVRAADGETLREVLIRAEIIEKGKDELLVFVGECEEALAEPDDTDDGADQHEPVDIGLTVEVLELRRHRHVHYHHCRRIAVEASFGTKAKKHKFSPAATIEVVTRWARKKLLANDAAASEYVLQICGTKTQPRSDQHLSQVVTDATCSICFELVPEVNPQG